MDIIQKAYEVAHDAHAGQRRGSGELYIYHPLAVARIVAEMRGDEVGVAAALIHDVVEDTEVSLTEIETMFGPDVALVVDGVTKVDKLSFDSKEDQEAATMRKMVVAIAQDPRVLMVKLADRLHNLRTIAGVSEEKQRNKAEETLAIYAPLANRMGFELVRMELEDLAFAAMYPKRYAEMDKMVAESTPELDEVLARMCADVRQILAAVGIHAELDGRGKNLWGIWEKMQIKGRPFKEIFDVVALRVVIPNDRDPYVALGAIHRVYRAMPGRFKDYISFPKFNHYQALHTTVLVDEPARPIEIQIRTQAMHDGAEHGSASHWSYRNGSSTDELSWLNRLAKTTEASPDGGSAYLTELRDDLALGEILVFTPKGQAVRLQSGATALDFAYGVHTEIGHKALAAKVNGQMHKLDYVLESGQVVEIVQRKLESPSPKLEWLEFVVTHRARQKIKQWFSRGRKADLIERGREELDEVFRTVGRSIDEVDAGLLSAELTKLGYDDLDEACLAIGSEAIIASAVADPVFEALKAGTQGQAISRSRRSSHRRHDQSEVGIHVEGFEGVLVRFSLCCTPVPPDEIVGFLTRGRGISVHRADCTNAGTLEAVPNIRLVDVEWNEQQARAKFVASIELQAFDRDGLLRDVAGTISDHELNILSCHTQTDLDRISSMRFELEFADAHHVNITLRALSDVQGVFEAKRARS